MFKPKNLNNILPFLLTFSVLPNLVIAGVVNDLIFKNSLEANISLLYTVGEHGTLNGVLAQTIEQSGDGTSIQAIPDPGYHFANWSDASTQNPRTDFNVQSNLSVTAFFLPDSFGLAGTHSLAPIYQEPNELASIYYPNDASAQNPVPVIFFAPGWGSGSPSDYQSLLTFIASHGVAVVYAKDEQKLTSSDMLIDFVSMVNDPAINPLLDTSRIGVIGHSVGGGHTFNILDKLSDEQGWGSQARLLFAIEPWFAFDMMQLDMRTLPSNTNIVIQQYGMGGNNIQNNTDARIPLTEYYLLESIADSKKDYQIYPNANHHYPQGSADYSTMQGLLAPLDALMELTFTNPVSDEAHTASLELGNDDPYANNAGIQVILDSYDYPCNGIDFTEYDIDFCDIKGYPYSSKLTSIASSPLTPQPSYPGMSIDAAFNTVITRVTDRINQNDTPLVDGNGDRLLRGNAHPYPKTQSWNQDMTMLRLHYRLYDANTLQELAITSGTNNLSNLYQINGSLSEFRWSSIDPEVYFGIFGNQFWKSTIDRSNNQITFELLHDFTDPNIAYDYFTLGKYEGNIDFNDRYVVFAARKTGTNYLTAILYDIQNNTSVKVDFTTILWTDFPDPQVLDWISVSPLGNHILMNTSNTIRQYDLNFNFVRELASSGEHGDLGVAQNGEEVYVQFEFGDTNQQGIWIYRLSDGFHTRLLPSKYNGGHISCRNYLRKGWCYLSTTEEGFREVFAVRLNFAGHEKHVVNRFAQTHTSELTSEFNSLGSVSPDGRRILFYTDWEDSSLNYYDRDTYQATIE